MYCKSSDIEKLYESFKSQFDLGWIEKIKWSGGGDDKKILTTYISSLTNYYQQFIESMCKFVLSAHYLVDETEDPLKNFSFLVESLIEEDVDQEHSDKDRLAKVFQKVLLAMHYAILLVRDHYKFVMKHFKVESELLVLKTDDKTKFSDDTEGLLDLLHIVCDVCVQEYDFSYVESYIQNLLLLRIKLKDLRDKFGGEFKNIVKAAYFKVDFLLKKLSIYSNNNEIRYYHNFRSEKISSDKGLAFDEKNLNSLFEFYIEPSKIEKDLILKWQNETHKESVSMWQLTFLMRYYSQVNQLREQMDNLIDLAERHVKEYYEGKEHNIINDYAVRIFVNYMYNSRFSFLCKKEKGYTMEDMQDDLGKIEFVQEENFIHNYYPYKKALDFSIAYLNRLLINGIDSDRYKTYLERIKQYFEKLKINVEWCKRHMKYPIQMRYKFSCNEPEMCRFEVFYPSSFCRPIKFSELEETIQSYAAQISYLEFQVKHYEENLKLKIAMQKVDKMEESNMKKMGIFVTLMTFLVGMLSIFIGNTAQVSIFQRMEYVTFLGIILLLLIGFGYLMVSGGSRRYKLYVVGILTLFFIILYAIYFYKRVLAG